MLLFKRRNKEVGDDEAAQRQSSDKTFITPSFWEVYRRERNGVTMCTTTFFGSDDDESCSCCEGCSAATVNTTPVPSTFYDCIGTTTTSTAGPVASVK
jgi:hypothetical protein